ncbi:hypothetical protein Acid345_3800 [Candidatus Koribacter versatilis Ellin345]|uniref:O-antigen ligase-related domain-containing protein n=2 Tax=Candidatus Korobacter versatilis TaxID=658062 RepID=Q1IK00_KORVE|nr:hypothetical protein Acid345_3800 [Candidatus Koribacter versatilis Ellin345]
MYLTQTRLQNVWLKALMACLVGYALLGKGFAYLFIGECVLVAGFAIFLLSRRATLVASDSVLLLWGLFAFWGACRTIPFLSTYHFDAIRDAVLWGYGLTALFIVASVNSAEQIASGLNAYRKFLRWYMPLLPIILLLSGPLRPLMPVVPWSRDAAIVMLKPGDASVHLAAAALFWLILERQSSARKRRGFSAMQGVAIAGWFGATMFVLVRTRAGVLAIIIPMALVSLLKLRRVAWKVGVFAVAGTFLLAMILESNLIQINIHGRKFSSEQITNNLYSIAGQGDEKTDLENTKVWRLIWWRHIVQYTVFGPYFWTGKGFGINLVLQDGPPHVTEDDKTTRSPHNGSMTVLARMGVPGLVMWASLNLVFLFRMLRAYRRAARSGAQFWASVNLWVLCYWIAAFINLSFDVYIEGPVGGILFWSIIGFGVSCLRVQSYEARQIAHGRVRNFHTRSAEQLAVRELSPS